MRFSRISNLLILTALLVGVREVDSQLNDILGLASTSGGQSPTAAASATPAPSALPTATSDPIGSTAAAPAPTTEASLPSPPPLASPTQGDVPNGASNPSSSGTSATENKKRPTSSTGGPKPQHSSKNNGSNGNGNADAAAEADTSPSDNPSLGDSGSQQEKGSSAKEKIGMVAGSVVGGLVCIALVAGLLTWLNRRGGCTSPRRRRYNPDQPNTSPDDFSIPMHDARRYIQPASAQGYVSLQDPPTPLPYQQQQKQQEAIWDYKPNETYLTRPGQKPNVP